MASLACLPKYPSPMAALHRMSFSVSLRAPIKAGTTCAGSPFRCCNKRTAMSRSRSLDDFRSSINWSVDFPPQPLAANNPINNRQRVCGRIVKILGLLRNPIVGQLTACYRAQGLIGDGVDAAREKMHRAVAEQEIRSLRGMHAVKRIRVVKREVGAGQMCGVGMGQDPGLAPVRIVVSRSGRRRAG